MTVSRGRPLVSEMVMLLRCCTYAQAYNANQVLRAALLQHSISRSDAPVESHMPIRSSSVLGKARLSDRIMRGLSKRVTADGLIVT